MTAVAAVAAVVDAPPPTGGPRAFRDGGTRPSKTAKPSPRQVYLIARLALRVCGRELPESKAGAHDLIQELQAALAEMAPEARTGDDCPF